MLVLNILNRRFLQSQLPNICKCLNMYSFHSPTSLRVLESDYETSKHRLGLNNNVFISQYNLNKRFKSDKNKKSRRAEESDSDDDDLGKWKDDEGMVGRDSKVLTVKTGSMRADVILKSALNIARNKIDVLFYESKLRLNGKKIMKKSLHVQEGDEIDVIKGYSTVNPAHLIVGRVEVLQAVAKEENIAITIRRYKSLVIENYEDPWKGNDDKELS